MTKQWKRVLAMLLVVIMIGSAAPLGALAEMDWPTLPDEYFSEKTKNGLFSLRKGFIAVADWFGSLCLSASAESNSGSCGDDVKWALDIDTGVLSITGTGSMTNYSLTDSSIPFKPKTPWYSNHSYIQAVTISSGVKSIGTFAFMDLERLTSVTIPDSVTSIGKGAFSNCTSLTSITIPASVTSIGNQVFCDCTSLSSITIPDSVTSIEYYAFYGCTGLTSVTIPDSVTSIGYRAFEDCKGLTNISIPDSVTELGSSAFSGCTSLTSITIPDSVACIGDSVFGGCTSLVDIAIPDSVMSIGNSVFSGCTSLTSIAIPDSVTYIGDYAFNWCTNLTSVTIPDSVTSIGKYAFLSCSSLTDVTIPGSMTSISEGAFSRCTGLTSITIPDSVTSIEKEALSGCTSITSITIPDSVACIGDSVLGGCTSLASIAIPDSVMSIGNSVFSGCTSLTSIAIPNSVTTIGSDAFYKCTGLASVTIPDSVTSIGEFAFSNCTSLESITIPDSVTSIGDKAFRNCTILKSVTIPDSVISIGWQAFSRCTSLARVSIEDGVMSIGAYAFSYCYSLTSIVIPDSVIDGIWGAFSNCTKLASVTIGNGVTRIGDSTFENCTNLISITIPDGVTSIGKWAFSDCTILMSITIPNSVTSIESYAFARCTSLADVYFMGSQSLWNQIAIDSENEELLSATIHYVYGDLACTQVHTVSNYVQQNDKNESRYLGGLGLAMDGTNGTSDFCIPGLSAADNMVPQGIAYCASRNWMLITAYSKKATPDPSCIFALDFDTGDLVAQFALVSTKGNMMHGHVGGIAVSGDNIYLTNGNLICYIPLNNLDAAAQRATVQSTYAVSDLMNGASCSYVTITDGVLWTGNFYEPSDSRYNTPAQPPYNSKVMGFQLSGTGDQDEWNAFSGSAPDYSFLLPTQIRNIQSATVKSGKLLLTASFGRKNPSAVYTAQVSGQTGALSYDSFETIIGLPMMEGMCIYGNYMYSITESAAFFYNGQSASVSKDPTDVVWKINYAPFIAVEKHTESLTYASSETHVSQVTASLDTQWFAMNNKSYNHQLAQFCAVFSMLGYMKTTDEIGCKRQLKNDLNAMGFTVGLVKDPENPEEQHYAINLNTNRDEVNYFIAHQDIMIDGKKQTLVFAGLIGSNHEQWFSNFDPRGESSDRTAHARVSENEQEKIHLGFADARDFMLEKLNQYYDAFKINPCDVRLLLTGHSRGAAAANLLAAKLINSGELADPDHIFAYTFATPRGTAVSNVHQEQYNCIFNIVNPEDFVTKVMLDSWGYDRYGVTYTLPSKTNDVLAYKYILQMNPYFMQYTGSVYKPYIEGEATTYLMTQMMNLNVPTVNLFYNRPIPVTISGISFSSPKLYITPFEFFNKTLIPIVSKTNIAEGLANVAKIVADPMPSTMFYKSIITYFLVHNVEWTISLAFAQAHQMETYCAYMQALTGSQLTQNRSGFLNSVNCPVDVDVYDKATGELVGRIRNNVVDEEIAAKENSVVMFVDGESKKYWLPENGNYEVKLIGNDDGVMDYSVAEVDSDVGEVQRVNFFDVTVEEDKMMTGDVSGEEFDLQSYTLQMQDAEAIAPTETLDADNLQQVQINVTVDGYGAADSTVATSGDYVQITAVPQQYNSFLGWYEEDTLIETQETLAFVAKTDRQLTAKFTSVSEHVHTYDAVISPATCTMTGTVTMVCSECGGSYVSETIPALGHDFDESIEENVSRNEPGGTTPGKQTVLCSRCGKKHIAEIPPTGAPTIMVSDATAKPGETVMVTVEVQNNPGVVAMLLRLNYDNERLTLIDVQREGFFANGSYTPSKSLTYMPYSVSWEDNITEQDYTEDTAVLIYTFTVKEDAPFGTTAVTLSYDAGSTFNVDLEDAKFAVRNGTVTITDRLPGDANGDGEIDLKDVVVTRRFLAGGWDVEIQTDNADVNGDRIVNLRDTVLLTRHIVGGWNTELI